MDLEKFKQRLKGYKKEDIIFTSHAKIQALMRQIDLEEVKDNIINPSRLVYVEEEPKNSNAEKYGCYFTYEEYHCHKYILTLNRKVIIVTIININRNWQKIIEGKK